MKTNTSITPVIVSVFALIGAIIQHLIAFQNLSLAVHSAPTTSTMSIGALIGGILSLAAPNIPLIGPILMKFVTALNWLFGARDKISAAFPPELMQDIVKILLQNNGTINLADIEKLIADFEKIDPTLIFQLIREAVSLFTNTPVNPDSPPSPAKSSNPVSDIQVHV